MKPDRKAVAMIILATIGILLTLRIQLAPPQHSVFGELDFRPSTPPTPLSSHQVRATVALMLEPDEVACDKPAVANGLQQNSDLTITYDPCANNRLVDSLKRTNCNCDTPIPSAITCPDTPLDFGICDEIEANPHAKDMLDRPVAALCSGVLIGPDLVATVAHCLEHDEVDGDMANLRVVVGYTGESLSNVFRTANIIPRVYKVRQYWKTRQTDDYHGLIENCLCCTTDDTSCECSDFDGNPTTCHRLYEHDQVVFLRLDSEVRLLDFSVQEAGNYLRNLPNTDGEQRVVATGYPWGSPRTISGVSETGEESLAYTCKDETGSSPKCDSWTRATLDLAYNSSGSPIWFEDSSEWTLAGLNAGSSPVPADSLLTLRPEDTEGLCCGINMLQNDRPSACGTSDNESQSAKGARILHFSHFQDIIDYLRPVGAGGFDGCLRFHWECWPDSNCPNQDTIPYCGTTDGCANMSSNCNQDMWECIPS